jgi:hypothetical protein
MMDTRETGVKTVAERWQEFALGVINVDAPPEQRSEMRRAFFAGAYSILGVCMGISEDSVSEDQGIEILEATRKELEQFFADVKDGKA